MSELSFDPEKFGYNSVDKYRQIAKSIENSIGKRKLLMIRDLDGNLLRLFPSHLETKNVEGITLEIVIGVEFGDADNALGFNGIAIINIKDIEIEDIK